MSYHIYTTRGIILSERPLREADRIYSIITEDLGLIRASALGVRKENSKIRGNIEPFSLVSVSLVRGKEYWRITSAELISRILPDPYIARPLSLVEKLVQGESPHPELFSVLKDALEIEEKNEEFEITLVSKIMNQLGYLSESDLNLDRKSLISAINEGIQASHL